MWGTVGYTAQFCPSLADSTVERSTSRWGWVRDQDAVGRWADEDEDNPEELQFCEIDDEIDFERTDGRKGDPSVSFDITIDADPSLLLVSGPRS